MIETMKLCVACKGCKRECPTGVDMSAHENRGPTSQQTPRAVPARPARRLSAPLRSMGPENSGNSELTGQNTRTGKAFGSYRRPQREAHVANVAPRRVRCGSGRHAGPRRRQTRRPAGRYLQYLFRAKENVGAAARVLAAAGYRVTFAAPPAGERPLCCGRTFLSAGLVDEARVEARRTIEALAPHVAAGTPIVGLEPSCLDDPPR